MQVSVLKAIVVFCLVRCCPAKIMRNRALLTKMISNFHNGRGGLADAQPSPVSPPPPPSPDTPEVTEMNSHVVSVMQSVLCRNFPSVPCDVITHDPTLKKLIMGSIEQIIMKTPTTTPEPPVAERQTYFRERPPRVKVYRKIGVGSDYTKKRRSREKSLPTRQETLVKLYPARKKNVITLKMKKYHNSTAPSTWRKDTGAVEDRLSISDEEASELLGNGLRDDGNPSTWHLDYYKAGSDKVNYEVDSQNELRAVFADGNAIDNTYKSKVSNDVFIRNSFRSKHFASEGND